VQQYSGQPPGQANTSVLAEPLTGLPDGLSVTAQLLGNWRHRR